ncbi:MAG: methyl-accepting chemotaxis protein, partial [bacterium]
LSSFRNILIKETKNDASEQVRSVSIELEGYLKEKAKVGWAFSKNPLIIQWLQNNTRRVINVNQDRVYKEIMDYLEHLTNEDQGITSAYLASQRTQMLYDCRQGNMPENYYITQKEWYKKIVDSGESRFDVNVDVVSHEIEVNYRCPVYDEKQNFVGIAGVKITLNKFSESIAALYDAFAAGQVFIMDKDGTLLFHPNKSYVLKKKITDFPDDGRQYKHMNEASQNFMQHKDGVVKAVFQGKSTYFIYNEIPSLGWKLVLGVAVSEFNKPVTGLVITYILISLLTLLLLYLIIGYLTRFINIPLEEMVTMFKNVSDGQGDLTKRLKVYSDDEIGILAQWFNEFVQNVHELIVSVRNNIKEIVQASENLKNTTETMSKGAEDQSNTTSNIASSTREMSTTINETSRIYNQAVVVVKKATEKAQDGNKIINRSVDGMQKIADSVEKSQVTLNELSTRSNEIGKIIQVIDEIAEQTNLLALNARIEAAGAGEEGKGFAVVAEDISTLAERTSEATKDISKIIKGIQNDMTRVVESMEEGIKEVDNGTELVKDSGNVLSEIMLNVEEIQQVISELSQASEQMTLASEEISKNTKSIDIVTSGNVKNTKNLSAIAAQLMEKADSFNNLIQQFKI